LPARGPGRLPGFNHPRPGLGTGLSTVAVKILALTLHRSHTGGVGMIEFWRKLWHLIRPYKGRFFLGALFGVLSGFADTVVLVTVAFVASVVFSGSGKEDAAKIVDQLNKTSPWLASAFLHAQQLISTYVAGSKASLVLVVSLIPLVMLGRGVCNYLNNYLMNWVAIRAISDLRARVFEHLLNLPLSFLSRTSTGELMSRIGDVGILQSMIGGSLVTLAKEPVNTLVLLTAAFMINAKLTLIALVTFPFCAIPVVVYNRKVRKAGAAIQTEAANLGKVMHESFTGNRIIKGYNLEQVVMDRFRANQKKFISHFMRLVRSTETPGPMIELFAAIGISILLFYLAGSTSPAQFAKFIAIVVVIYRPVKAVIRVQSQLHQARAATQRVFELLATQSTLTDPPQPVPLHAAGAEIQFDNISFNYGEKPVLRHIQLRVEPGRMVALVGSSGAGKSTLTNLLLRFYDPTEGVIRIGGIDLRQAALRDIRSQIAVVTQEVILFNDTIRQNIAYGRPDAAFAEIEEAARHAFAHDFILGKPRGYDSVVGEKGTNLSGGERQRIAIARAILKNAPVLVLDEATSSLDNESERAVQAALDELMKGRTTICIAHRLSTVHHADVIVVLDHGEIVEMGRHEELLARRGMYYKLYTLGLSSGDPR
jgi:ATP-binding cassette, subfamily B, bacterial MsbA